PTECYTLSLHDALPISGLSGDGVVLRPGRGFSEPPDPPHGGVAGPPLPRLPPPGGPPPVGGEPGPGRGAGVHRRRLHPGPPPGEDRKSTRLNSSHVSIS